MYSLKISRTHVIFTSLTPSLFSTYPSNQKFLRRGVSISHLPSFPQLIELDFDPHLSYKTILRQVNWDFHGHKFYGYFGILILSDF